VKVHNESIGEIDRYIRNFGQEDLNAKIPEYERILRYLRKAREIDSNARILEIGTGTGWFPILCQLKGMQCKGLEISPQLIEVAMGMGRREGVVPDIELGNVEVDDIGVEKYDAIVASSVFEHIEFWRPALTNIYKALKPGGALFFESTNKYMLKSLSAEFAVPFYGWLPDRARYELRKAHVHGQGRHEAGDRFPPVYLSPTAAGLQRKRVSSEILDVIDLLDLDGRTGLNRRVLASREILPSAAGHGSRLRRGCHHIRLPEVAQALAGPNFVRSQFKGTLRCSLSRQTKNAAA
jgi:SAM-dependent methyltransferase